jgi:hypothetical protein
MSAKHAKVIGRSTDRHATKGSIQMILNKKVHFWYMLICSIFTNAVEAQENRVLQCDVKGWIENLSTEQTGAASNSSFMLEFLPNGQVLETMLDANSSVTSELSVTSGQTAYVFKRNAGDLFMTLDRLTGVIRSTTRIDKDRIIDNVGTCRSIRVVPKL